MIKLHLPNLINLETKLKLKIVHNIRKSSVFVFSFQQPPPQYDVFSSQ